MTTAGRPARWELAPEQAAPGGSDSAWEYVAVRITGVLLAVLVLGHFAVTHFVTDVAHDDAGFVARRLSSALWVAWDSTMLAAALAHGGIGIRLVIADYAGSTRSRHVLTVASTLGTVAIFAVGVFAVVRAAHV